ncbi:hypothetical protein H4219_003881 [Mycoemilia scoparia]|uniref:snRNA-activating protein complex subunit 3 n=1 Tax=Mycoemilia scoparia TaxID=417184 RepID=A0A9W8DS10_9FUNG|nr:hypothetical protein H4219_003881 [Mycoemilia scoparia]
MFENFATSTPIFYAGSPIKTSLTAKIAGRMKKKKKLQRNAGKVTEDYSFSSSAFVNPTLFSMLRKHREFTEATEREIQRRKNEEVQLLRQQEQALLQGLIQAENEYNKQQGMDIDESSILAAATTTTTVTTDPITLTAHDVDGNENRQDTDHEDDANAQDTSNLIVFNTEEDGYQKEGTETTDQIEHGDANTPTVDKPDFAPTNNEPNSTAGDANTDGDAMNVEAEDPSSEINASGGNAILGDQMKGLDQATINDAVAKLTAQPLNSEENNNIEDVDDQNDLGETKEGGDGKHSGGDSNMDIDNELHQEVSTEIGASAPQGDQDTQASISGKLPQGITPGMFQDAVENSGFSRSEGFTQQEDEQKENFNSTNGQSRNKRAAKMQTNIISDLEQQFCRVADMLDKSSLASLREVNRRMIPHKQRLELNFLTNRMRDNVTEDSEKIAKDEVILGVCFYNPRNTSNKMEEYLVLGSQPLTALRDAFYCISDFLITNRDQEQINTKDKKISSSYFHIEKTFYNDMRSPTATDYSRVIIEWAKQGDRAEKCPRLQNLQSRLMDGARFIDLSVRLRYPYLFVHQGNCEHIMMFTELRMANQADDQFVDQYPKQVFRTRQMRHKCRMCASYPAQYVTKNDFHSGMSPCYFCEKCYTPFHYDEEGKLLLEHEVYPYASANI